MKLLPLLILALIPLDIFAYLDTPYHVAPRLLSNCEQSYIGYEYHPWIHPACKRLWDMWTRELILSDAEYFTSLSI